MPETNARIKVCHDTAANFKTNNPTLLVGEWALETDTKKMKIGDGSTAYNSLPYSTAEDSDEWRKPADWIDISSGAMTNSIYLLVGHTLDFSKYKELCFSVDISTSSNTYDVYVDGIKQATTASGTDTTLNWQTLALDSGYDVTYPSALRTHIVRITPTQSTDTMSRFRFRPISGQIEQGLLWAHFELSNPIRIPSSFGTESGIRNYLLEAVTAKNDNITYAVASSLSGSGFYSAFRYCTSLKKIPVLTAESTTYKSGEYIAFSNVSLKKVVIKNNKGTEGLGFLNVTNVEEFDIENGVILSSNILPGNDAHGASNLKKFPRINASDAETFQTYGLTSLQDTFIDDSSNSSRKVLRFYGADASNPVLGLKGLVVSNAAPFDGASPQINVSYTGLSRAALVNLFKSMPYNVGYEVVGSPTITDGVASGFSNSDYLISSQALDVANYANLEFYIRCKTPIEFVPSTWTNYITNGTTVNNAGRTLGVYKGSSYVVFNVFGTDMSTYQVSENTWYRVKLVCTSDTQTATIYNDDGTILVGPVSTTRNINNNKTLMIGGGTAANIGSFGQIDLNNTYVNTNGIPWFRGTAAMTKTCSIVGCTGTAELTQKDKNIALDKGWELTVA